MITPKNWQFYQKNDIILKEVAEKAVFQGIVKDFNLRLKEVQDQIKQLMG